MEENENLPIVSGDVENIIIKLEPTEDFLGDEDSPVYEEIDSQVNEEIGESEDTVFYGGFCSNEVSPSSSEENESNIIQTPFYLENYFSDSDSRNLNDVVDMNYLTCDDRKILFPTEKLQQHHLITYIDIHRMGCNICDKDLNTAEKFQLHIMAITRQSIYYCDLCRKSCAGVVRSKDQARPVGKTYACHDCEMQSIGKPCVLNGSFPVTPNHCKIDNCTLHSESSTGTDILKIHKEKHSEGGTCNACEHCPKVFTLDTILQSNKIKNENFKIEYKLNGSKFNPEKCFHRCGYCDAFFAESFTLARHLRERHNLGKIEVNSLRNSKPTSNDETKSRKFECKHCEVVFSEQCKLTKHLKEKHKLERNKSKNVKPSVETKVSKNKFKCKQCDVSYSENFNLTKHLRQKHNKGKQKFICKLCLKEFTLQRCYDSHVSFHEIAKNYVCFACELAFLSKYELQQHLKIHNKKKKETECNKCEKNTLTDVSQKRHTRRTRIRNS